jgi:hypothetical protein
MAVVTVALGGLFTSTESAAQAWLPTKGSLESTLAYTNVLSQHHYSSNGTEGEFGSTRTETAILRVMYGLTDRLSVSGLLPYVKTQYSGAFPHPGEEDDGHAHTTLTDLRVGLHYQVSEGPIAFAPYVQYSTPLADYETMGHSAPGRGLDELWLGFFAGRNLDRWIPRAYVQFRYNYAFVEKVAGIKHDQSNLDLELAYRLSPRWTVRAMVFYQDSYGGVDLPIPPSNPLFPHHDQLGATDYTNIGAGASWSPSLNNTIHLLYLESIWGRNGHKTDQNLTLAWTWIYTPQ